MNWIIEQVSFDDTRAASLRDAQRQELDARYGSDDHEPGNAPTVKDVPVFFIARATNGSAVACGGLRPLSDDILGPNVVEIKRMYASPEARGTGAAVAVLRALEAKAFALGAETLALETGTLQPDAIRFYEREGYVSIPLFGPYAGSAESLCFAKRLRPQQI